MIIIKEQKDFENKILHGDSLEVLKELPSDSVNCVMTSPPYWALRDYGVDGQLGLEPNMNDYINKLCDIFDEVKRVLKKDGTCWVNMGDSYMGNSSYSEKGRQGFGKDKIGMMNKKQWLEPKYKHKEKLRARNYVKSGQVPVKSLCQIPSRFSIEMINRGWILRNEIIWHKNNAMPCSVKDRFTVDFEKLFFFTKSKKYYFKSQYEPLSKSSIDDFNNRKTFRNKGSNNVYSCPGENRDRREFYRPELGRNKRTTWTINTKPYRGAHFAVFPEKLCETPIKAGCPKNGIVLDPFFGAGTTGVVAKKQNKKYIGIELNLDFIKIAEKRINEVIL